LALIIGFPTVYVYYEIDGAVVIVPEVHETDTVRIKL